MVKFSLILAFGLSMAVNAFKFRSDEFVDMGDYFDKRCNKALKTDIDCDANTRLLVQSSVVGWLGSNNIVDGLCLATCFDSLQRWNKTVTEECAKDLDRAYPPLQLGEIIAEANEAWQMWNATCIRDTNSGRYCFDVVYELRGLKTDGEKKPFKEICHPCYGMVVNAMLNASLELDLWGLDNDYWKGQLDLVHKKCGGPDKIEKNFEEQKTYNASHPREPELKESKGMTVAVNQVGGVGIAALIYGWSIFMFDRL
ncbi:hypothetical protein FSPOR_8892 [Fusarium sporotrichioides]|uniref:Uncharacterized protein n=1 Tax=Fusarium sporotrichioides TaxID=5514 RepID=A0A395RSZ7_FUSSP|nr:hypothetical protein FSPOR_8892 [Fusarium sporotrichioides]